jgi:diguanylate cyclase (GGDEF)-like protein
MEHTILVVDDAKDTQLLLDFDLTKAGYKVLCCDSGEEALLRIESSDIDLILLDMYMPGLSGLQTLEKIKAEERHLNTSIIMLSASNDEDEVVSALELGAADYVVKPYIAKILLARIRTAIKLKEKTEQLEYLAKTDFLTGIHNRGSFFDLSTHAINLSNRAGQPLVIAMLDIDHFKRVNDNYGHDAGDKVLVEFVACLTENFREYDILGRVGGEEFGVCLPNTTIEDAYSVCERLREQVERLIVLAGDNNEQRVKTTVSIGLAAAQGDFLSIDHLLKQADNALYYAKEHGRNRVIDSAILSETSDIKSIHQNDYLPAQLTKINTTDESKRGLEQKMVNIEGIDHSVGLNNVLGDEDLFKEILVMFYQDHSQDASKLKQAIDSEDMKSIKHIAHTLKGVSCSVGAMELFEKAKQLDSVVTDNKIDLFQSALTDLIPIFDCVMSSIKNNLTIDE